MSARQFFGTVCPRIVADRARHGVSGRFGFVVRGEPNGRWTLDFDNGSVSPNVVSDRVDVCVELESGDFTRLLAGTLDVHGATSAGRLNITGERARLSQLSQINFQRA